MGLRLPMDEVVVSIKNREPTLAARTPGTPTRGSQAPLLHDDSA